MVTWNDFYNLYPVVKTLRLGLRPIGKTSETFSSCGFLEEDIERNKNFLSVKKIIDDYHKAYIEQRFSNFNLKTISDAKEDSLEDYVTAQNDQDQKRIKAIQGELRKQIASHLTKGEAYERIYKAKLFTEDLPKFVANDLEADKKKQLISKFHGFTTCFSNYHKNRKNMYSEKAQSTAIAFRLIHENLPKFVDNMNTFDKLKKTSIGEELPQVFENFKEHLNVSSIEEMFRLSYFNKVLTQKQIDVYNTIIGAKSLNRNNHIQGLNEYINCYNQQHKEHKLPFLKQLFKQILSDSNSLSWLPESFDNSNQVIESIRDCYANLKKGVLNDSGLQLLLMSLPSYDLSRIYIPNGKELTTLSQKLLGDWNVIPKAIKELLKRNIPIGEKGTEKKFLERIEKAYKQTDSYSLAFINEALEAFGRNDHKVEEYFTLLGATTPEEIEAAQEAGKDIKPKENILVRIDKAYAQAKELLEGEYPTNKNLMQDKESVALIKSLLDELKALQYFIKPLMGNGTESEKDERFYGEFVGLWNELDQVTPLYNKVRNYVTQKPYSTEKIKIYFKNPTLLNGWDRNKEEANTAIILRKNGLYYLAIMRKENKYNQVFRTFPTGKDNNDYEKMECKNIPPKQVKEKFRTAFFEADKNKDLFNPSEKILSIYNSGSYSISNKETFNLNDCHLLIDYIKTCLQKYDLWKCYNFQFSPTSSYKNIEEFYDEAAQQTHLINFRPVDSNYVDQLVEEGKILLFQIYNKDFSPHSKGTPNLHTLYWKMLFDERNLNNLVYVLNANGEVFFRKKSLSYEHPTHPAGIPIRNKNILNKKKERVLKYDLIKNKRFTADSFLFHIPITMNFNRSELSNLNERVHDYLRQNEDAHIIGIDRGERHLLYLTLIDRHGRIKKQFSLNEIVNESRGETYHTNYHDLLDKREKERERARKSWQSIESIKELKNGYLSQVIHKIADLMVKYHAIVVLEDLNMGFMRGRQKVEKQVYQKFEKMLIDKLNYLVDKKLDPEAEGGLLKAYQLTNKFESFQKIGKQCGFLFYVPAWNTSKMDPCTGFVNLLKTRYENVEKAKKFFQTFNAIRYNATADYFEFELDYNKFTKDAKGTQTKWTLCTYGTRIITSRNPEKNSEWDSKEVILTDEFKQLFDQYGLSLTGNLQEAICQQTEKPFFETLLHLVKLMLQMRNSKTGTEIDYLLSPVRNAEGTFYDSRKGDSTLPENADANGAYNIARKGLWVIQQIKNGKARLAITNKEWLQYAQEKPYLKD